MDQWDEIVWREWPYMILKTVRPHSLFYNVYKANDAGTEWVKLNACYSWFHTEEAAIIYIRTGVYTNCTQVQMK